VKADAEAPGSASSSPYSPTVLLVEDDASLTRVLASAMSTRGYRFDSVSTGAAALERIASTRPDLVVLDLGLPDLDGIDLCREVRRWFQNPIIVLSADGDEARKIAALDEGADDYVTKPFSTDELFARLRVATRHRRVTALVAEDAVLRLGDLVVDTGRRTAWAGPDRLELPPKQFELLALLIRNPGRLVSYGSLMTGMWNEPRGDRYEALRWHASGLRKLLGEGPERPRLLNESGVGYRLVLAD
jgi:two-component system KDP operon response regulator KdpE